MSSPTTEACDLPWVPAGPCSRLTPFQRLVLKFVACGGAWPLGQLDYRTGVRVQVRLRKAVYGRGRPMQFALPGKSLLGNFQLLRQSFPFLNQASMTRLLLFELNRLPLRLFRADKALQCGFEPSDLIFGTTDAFFQFGDTIFHLLALDWVQTLFGLLRTVAL